MSYVMEKVFADHYPDRKADADAADALIGRAPDPVLAGLTSLQLRQRQTLLDDMRNTLARAHGVRVRGRFETAWGDL
jgi:hypothetical protein